MKRHLMAELFNSGLVRVQNVNVEEVVARALRVVAGERPGC